LIEQLERRKALLPGKNCIYGAEMFRENVFTVHATKLFDWILRLSNGFTVFYIGDDEV
jgi:hypothetical protein